MNIRLSDNKKDAPPPRIPREALEAFKKRGPGSASFVDFLLESGDIEIDEGG